MKSIGSGEVTQPVFFVYCIVRPLRVEILWFDDEPDDLADSILLMTRLS